jgi:hypothetical protein
MDLVSIYIDQSATTMSKSRLRIPDDEAVSDDLEALTPGWQQVAIWRGSQGEHGRIREKSSAPHLRYEFFKQIVKVFDEVAARFPCSTTSTRRTGMGEGDG